MQNATSLKAMAGVDTSYGSEKNYNTTPFPRYLPGKVMLL